MFADASGRWGRQQGGFAAQFRKRGPDLFLMRTELSRRASGPAEDTGGGRRCDRAAASARLGDRCASLDWDDLRFLLEVARCKRLTTAARHLRVTQSTVGRRLASLEQSLGVRLVAHGSDGYVLTPAGETIRKHLERVEAETRAIERAVGALDTRLEGVVRVSAPVVLANHLLALCMRGLHARHPKILLEIQCYVPDPNFAARETDIAVRLERFEHPELVIRRVGALGFGLYASDAWLDQHGDPDFAEGCRGQRLVVLNPGGGPPGQAQWLAEHAGKAHVALRTDCGEAQVAAAVHGGGLAVLPCCRADREPALRRLNTPVPVPHAEIWLAVHRDNRHVPRIRAVLDGIAAGLRAGAPAADTPEGAHSISGWKGCAGSNAISA